MLFSGPLLRQTAGASDRIGADLPSTRRPRSTPQRLSQRASSNLKGNPCGLQPKSNGLQPTVTVAQYLKAMTKVSFPSNSSETNPCSNIASCLGLVAESFFQVDRGARLVVLSQSWDSCGFVTNTYVSYMIYVSNLVFIPSISLPPPYPFCNGTPFAASDRELS